MKQERVHASLMFNQYHDVQISLLQVLLGIYKDDTILGQIQRKQWFLMMGCAKNARNAIVTPQKKFCKSFPCTWSIKIFYKACKLL